MVMEATPSPSPQSVGREFVRQYYTLLNKAPTHLHRFYNNFSSFVHGGLEAPQRETLPVVGQKQIHNRIQQLNFRDCHAKISQVDSQATLGSGVVVQVTGELSNAGAPMRRFTQTFVLAAQSPKKYYVHNDIFRYQDLVPDEEPERDDAEPAGYFPAPPAFPPLFPAPPRVSPPLLAPHLNGHPAPAASPPPPAEPAPAPPAAPAPAPVAAPAPQDPRPLQQPVHSASVVSVEPEPEPAPAAEPAPEPAPPREPSPPPPPPAVAASPPEPKTYANLLKSSAPAAAPAPAPAPPAPPHEPPRPRPQRPPRDNHHPNEGVVAGGGMRGDRGERPERGERGEARGERGEGARRYSDSQQLFLGNVPPSASEDELRALFARFGPVAELRVLGRAPHPHYGFVTYESARHAQDCLGATPLYFPPDSPDGVKLNVEEKKTRGAPAPRAGEPPRRRPNSTHRAFPPRQPYRR